MSLQFCACKADPKGRAAYCRFSGISNVFCVNRTFRGSGCISAATRHLVRGIDRSCIRPIVHHRLPQALLEDGGHDCGSAPEQHDQDSLRDAQAAGVGALNR